MYVLLLKFQVKPENLDQFIEEILVDASTSVAKEPGCFQFDVSRDEDDPNVIYLYEVYADKAAFEAHLETPHLKRWVEVSENWYAAEQIVYKGTTIFPDDSAWKNR